MHAIPHVDSAKGLLFRKHDIALEVWGSRLADFLAEYKIYGISHIAKEPQVFVRVVVESEAPAGRLERHLIMIIGQVIVGCPIYESASAASASNHYDSNSRTFFDYS